jgi:tetratricopeptide (TPR) repeat protein
MHICLPFFIMDYLHGKFVYMQSSYQLIKIQILLGLLIVSVSCTRSSECPEQINLLPMFGNSIKCPEQLAADITFTNEMDKQFQGNRKKAAQDRVARAWDYFNRNVQDTAMMRFNQAWLLDSMNADVYWGFGNLLGNNKKHKEALSLFKKSLKLNPINPVVWASTGQAYGNSYMQTSDRKELDSCIYYFRRSYLLDSSNGGTCSKLTFAYLEAMQKDSAKKFQALTDKIDPQLLSLEIREKIKDLK